MNEQLSISKEILLKIVLPLFACLIIVPVTGVYFDFYEGLFACFVSGDYFSPITDREIDLHFLLLPLYARINAFFPTKFVYGYFLLFFTIIILIYAYNIVIRYLKGTKYSLFYGLFLLLIFALVCFSSLSTIKITVILAGAIISDVILFNIKNRGNIFNYLKYVVLTIIVCLLRLDIAVLLTFFLFISSLLSSRHIKQTIIISLISAAFFLSHKVMLSKTSEAKKIFFYKEYELFDREQFNEVSLTENEKMSLSMLRFLAISDTLVYNSAFIAKVTEQPGNLMSSYLSNTNTKSALNILKKSAEAFFLSLPYIITAFIGIIMVLFSDAVFRMKIFFILLTIFPLMISFISVIPDRFLTSYYITLSAVLSIYFYLKNKVVTWLLTVSLMVISVIFSIKSIQKNQSDERLYQESVASLSKLNTEGGKPIIESLNYQFFPKCIFSERPKSDAAFLNAYLFNSYEAYNRRWQSMQVNNPLSLEEKMALIARKKMLLIMEQPRVNVYMEYFKKYYNIELVFSYNRPFNEHLNIYQVEINQPRKL